MMARDRNPGNIGDELRFIALVIAGCIAAAMLLGALAAMGTILPQ